jgi:hypothetical protein
LPRRVCFAKAACVVEHSLSGESLVYLRKQLIWQSAAFLNND